MRSVRLHLIFRNTPFGPPPTRTSAAACQQRTRTLGQALFGFVTFAAAAQHGARRVRCKLPALALLSINTMEAIEARLRRAHVGLTQVSLPPRAVYSNDEKIEAARAVEYNALKTRCEAQAAAWNLEARRWHNERVDVAAALFRVEASNLLASSPAGAAHSASSSPTRQGCSDDSAACSSTTLGESLVGGLSALPDMLAAECGLAANTGLATLCDDEIDVSAAVAEARERARWLATIAIRRAAYKTLCEEQRAAFVAQWRKRMADDAWMQQVPSLAPSPAAAAAADEAGAAAGREVMELEVEAEEGDGIMLGTRGGDADG